MAFAISWLQCTDGIIWDLEIFPILISVRVPEVYIVQTGNATENDGIRNYNCSIYLFPVHFPFSPIFTYLKIEH